MEKKKRYVLDDNRSESRKNFLIKLQLEYLTQKLRSQIYRNERYAKVASDIAAKKKNKILELSIKFNLQCMFNSYHDIENFICQYFWNDLGLPNFQYKDDEQRRVQRNYDCWYLLYRGTNVMYKGNEAKVLVNDPSKETVIIETFSGEICVKYSEINLKSDYQWN